MSTEKFPLQVLKETATDFLTAELEARLRGGDFVRNQRFYAPLARLILAEESEAYPELIEPTHRGVFHA